MSDIENEKMNTACSAANMQVQDKKEHEDDVIDSEDDVIEDIGDGQEGIGLILSLNIFKLLYAGSVWEDDEAEDKCISIAIVLPTGAAEENGDHRFSVTHGMRFQMAVMWPLPLADAPKLHNFWI